MLKVLPQYLKQIKEASYSSDLLVYRGQEDKRWKLRSAATRRLLTTDASEDDTQFVNEYLEYHKDLLDRAARIIPYGNSNQSPTPLQLLAKLQHFGAATGLLDFTYNPLVALWFSSQNADCDGSVFFLSVEPPQTAYVTPEHEQGDLDNLLSKKQDPSGPDYLIWEPTVEGDASLRILGQRSVFVIGRHKLNPLHVHSVPINASDKSDLRAELAQLDVSESSLFRDLMGFCSQESVRANYAPPETVDQLLLRANNAFKRRDYLYAINTYSKCIDLGGDAIELHSLRGNANAEAKKYRDAIKDYDEAQNLLTESIGNRSPVHVPFLHSVLLFNKGNMHASLNDFPSAAADYRLALQHHEDISSAYYNLGNVLFQMCEFEEAIKCYDEALERKIEQNLVRTLHNKALASVLLGRLEEAGNCYEQVQNAGEIWTHTLESLLELKDVLYGLPTSDLTVDVEPSLAVVTYSHPNYIGERKGIIFKGLAGNVGNFAGIVNSPAGSGFVGEPGIRVLVIRQ